MGWYDNHSPKELAGKTLVNVIIDYENNELELYFSDKTLATFLHQQECCESVWFESTEQEVSDLKLYIGQVLTDWDMDSVSKDVRYGSETITTLSFWFGNELVKIIWKGESNGYYSEGVNLKLTEVK